MDTKLKLFSCFFLATSYLLLASTSAKAAFVTVNTKGQITWQVLGDSTLEVKSIADNIAAPNNEISLDNSGGKIELNNIDVSNLKGDLVEVVARGNSNDLKIGSSADKFTIEENGITAVTAFPITIDPIKNQLSVTTNSGSRLLSVLPYEATLSLTRGNFITKLNANGVSLTEDSIGQLQYQIAGQKNINIFNVAKVSIPVNSTVSASSGEILKIDEPAWLRVFGFLFT